jgi:unsaturated rhamnogalacturonyl hydrolase
MKKPLTRRQMLATSAALVASVPFLKAEKSEDYVYLLAKVTGAEVVLPVGSYIPFDWSVGEIGSNTVEVRNPDNSGMGVKLSWNPSFLDKKKLVRLRITSATDVREVLTLEVKTAISGKKIADWDMRFACYMQPFDLAIAAEDVEAVFTEGVILTMKQGTKPFWFFTQNEGEKTAPNAFLPHLLVYKKPKKDAWQDRLLSLESIQVFGWMQGVVFDGLFEMSQHSAKAKAVLAQHLDLYFKDNSLVYANYNNVKSVENITTVESILPFAILAQTNPTHPLLKTAINFCEKYANTEGGIADDKGDNRMVKTEECYTVSYPLAVLAKTLNRPNLAHLAIKTLQSRVLILDKGNSIFQRGLEKGELFFENWGRGVAWYLLGLVKTLVHLPESADKEAIKVSLKKAVEKVIAYQQENGLWYTFFHQPETGFETSGTAGITAALMYGFEHNLLGENAKNAALKAQNGLSSYFTPDGFLAGTTQVNKPQGGGTLQLNGFRVISPYTLGFLAHFKTKRK